MKKKKKNLPTSSSEIYIVPSFRSLTLLFL